MDNEKQIEEMCEIIASMICEVYNPLCDENKPHTCSRCYANSTKIGDFAEMLYNAGYRKQSEVAEEIIGEVRQALLNMVLANAVGETYDLEKFFAELKKRYTEES